LPILEIGHQSADSIVNTGRSAAFCDIDTVNVCVITSGRTEL